MTDCRALDCMVTTAEAATGQRGAHWPRESRAAKARHSMLGDSMEAWAPLPKFNNPSRSGGALMDQPQPDHTAKARAISFPAIGIESGTPTFKCSFSVLASTNVCPDALPTGSPPAHCETPDLGTNRIANAGIGADGISMSLRDASGLVTTSAGRP